MRPDWDSYFMKIAYAVSERSTCDRAFVGCVIVREKRILTTGFNGSPAGQEHCEEIGHLMVEAVSYTHLDVYKRQRSALPPSGDRSLRNAPARRVSR